MQKNSKCLQSDARELFKSAQNIVQIHQILRLPQKITKMTSETASSRAKPGSVFASRAKYNACHAQMKELRKSCTKMLPESFMPRKSYIAQKPDIAHRWKHTFAAEVSTNTFCQDFLRKRRMYRGTFALYKGHQICRARQRPP